MMRMLLLRGLLSGLVTGLLALLFARLFGEPSVQSAIDFESAEEAAGGAAPMPELVSRAVLGGYLTVFVVPFLKYPANPPAVGSEDSIDHAYRGIPGWC